MSRLFTIKDSDFLVTDLRGELESKQQRALLRAENIVSVVKETFEDWSSRRFELECIWKSCWAEFISSPESALYIEQAAKHVVGDVDTQWRHRIPTSKGYDLVETVNSYLQAAFFPNDSWFDVKPLPNSYMDDEQISQILTLLNNPEWKDLMETIRKYLLAKFNQQNFSTLWDSYCRQLLIVGTSVLALPWREEKKITYKNIVDGGKVLQKQYERITKRGLDMSVVNMLDFYMNPDERYLENSYSSCIRVLWKTKGEVIRCLESGEYPYANREDIVESTPSHTFQNTDRRDLQEFTGITRSGTYSPKDMVQIIEYWGDLVIDDVEYFDVVATVTGNSLLDLRPNPYWSGKPFIVGTLVPTLDSPYGISLLSNVLGQLHQLFIAQNHRLDASELTLNPMYKVVEDGILELDTLFSSPGKLIRVGDLNNIAPMNPPQVDLANAVNEEILLEQRVDKTTGVGAYIGVNSGRSAERVTAEEVRSQRDAGGNRLNRIYKHIEQTSLAPLINKVYKLYQQFVLQDEIVRLDSTSGEGFDYLVVGTNELQYEVDIVPKGADNIADKEFELRQRMDFIQVVSSNPELAQRVNWESVLIDLSKRFLRDDYEQFLKLQPDAPAQNEQPVQPQQQEAAPPNPMQQVLDQARVAGGGNLESAVQQLSQSPEQLTKALGNLNKGIYG